MSSKFWNASAFTEGNLYHFQPHSGPTSRFPKSPGSHEARCKVAPPGCTLGQLRSLMPSNYPPKEDEQALSRRQCGWAKTRTACFGKDLLVNPANTCTPSRGRHSSIAFAIISGSGKGYLHESYLLAVFFVLEWP